MGKGRRNSRILAAARMKAAVDKYLDYFVNSARQGVRVGTGNPRPQSKDLYIVPFGITVAATQKVRQTGSETSWTKYKNELTTHTTETMPSGAGDVLRPAGYRAARVVIITGRSDTGVATISNVTGLKYLKYGGKSTSLPFGKKTDTEEENTAFLDIEAKIKASATGGVKVSWTREEA